MSRSLIFLLCFLVLSGCGSTVSKPRARVYLSGSTALLPLVKAAAVAFSHQHPEVQVQATGGGSFLGFYQVWSGAVDVGMADVTPPPGAYPGLEDHPVAIIPYAVVVNRGVVAVSLSKDQLAALFSGRADNWLRITGQNLPVVVVGRPGASGSRRVLEGRILGGRAFSPRGIVLPSSGAVREAVAATPGAIGYLEVGRLSSTVKAVAVDGVPYSPMAILTGRYPFYGLGRFYTRGMPPGYVRDFLALVTGAGFQRKLLQLGYLPAQLLP